MTGRQDPLWRAVLLLGVSWRRVVLAVLAGAGGLGSAVALAAVSAWLIARASQMPPVMELSIAAVAVRTFGISRGLLRYVERLVSHDVALRGMATLREQIYRRLAVGRTEPVMALRRGDLLARVGADVDAVGDVVVRGLLPAAVAAVVSLGSVVLLGVFLPTAGLALAGCLVLAGVVAPWWSVRAARTTERLTAHARVEMSAVTLALLDGAGELTVQGRTPDLRRELARVEADLARATDTGARPAALAAAAGPLATGLAVLAALALAVPATTQGLLTPVELAVVVLTPLAAFEAVSLMPAAGVQVLRSRQAARRIMSLLDEVAQEPTATQPAPMPPAAPGRGLVVRGLACGWPGQEPLLTGLDLDLSTGRTVAVVGPSGAGKTTLLLTLAGLLPAVGGTLTLDGDPPADLPREVAASRVAMTAEDAHVFDTTILENLRVGRGDVTPDEALDALTSVGLGRWLAGLPQGLGTVLGADAARISGGERRRLLLARALLCPAPLLLVDEPTEHLDTGGEAVLRSLLDRTLTPDRGVLVVTHRLAGLEGADEVILLDRTGTVRARGRHSELVARDHDGVAPYRDAWLAEVQES
ncbi:thiol reductant ABC exporter subunit CydC [Actinotalea sp. K2]|uniref:thiol reductant ABC exporter subunit CydC n=1 Tax=Actinotalea sp. K2 TaxID=2939438 RepID=UPI002016D5FC|nr:thiol reductant ABC exporter subunit CydC [Actinotalea sp. K2]MCL3860549.1 thiol reductant ABC exporter subunit CydC [Actinotalea sp. K2]